MINRTRLVLERVAGATSRGSVYLRSHPGMLKRRGCGQRCKDGEWKAFHSMLHRDMEASWDGCRPMIGTHKGNVAPPLAGLLPPGQRSGRTV